MHRDTGYISGRSGHVRHQATRLRPSGAARPSSKPPLCGEASIAGIHGATPLVYTQGVGAPVDHSFEAGAGSSAAPQMEKTNLDTGLARRALGL